MEDQVNIKQDPSAVDFQGFTEQNRNLYLELAGKKRKQSNCDELVMPQSPDLQTAKY
jgi:hypothetical protein